MKLSVCFITLFPQSLVHLPKRYLTFQKINSLVRMSFAYSSGVVGKVWTWCTATRTLSTASASLLFLYFSYYFYTPISLLLLSTLFFQYRKIENIRYKILCFPWSLLFSNFSVIFEEAHNEKICGDMCWNDYFSSEDLSDLCIIWSLYRMWDNRCTRKNQRVNFSFLSLSSPNNTCVFLSHVTSAAFSHITVELSPFRSRTYLPWYKY